MKIVHLFQNKNNINNNNLLETKYDYNTFSSGRVMTDDDHSRSDLSIHRCLINQCGLLRDIIYQTEVLGGYSRQLIVKCFSCLGYQVIQLIFTAWLYDCLGYQAIQLIFTAWLYDCSEYQ